MWMSLKFSQIGQPERPRNTPIDLMGNGVSNFSLFTFDSSMKTRAFIKNWISSNFRQIRPLTMELAALVPELQKVFFYILTHQP